MESDFSEEVTSRSHFREGDLALMIDRKGRRYLLILNKESVFHTHMGYLEHTNIIGKEQGDWFYTNSGHRFLSIKPTLADYVLEMDRVTQIIYPKDIGTILMLGDIFPGAQVVEAGFGSGALTLALLRAAGGLGKVTSYELRNSQAEKALKNITPFLPNHHTLTIKESDIYQGIEEQDIDRIILDVPEPWNVVPSATTALIKGGVFLSFLPTILQVHRLVEALDSESSFQLIETVEVMLRSWHVTHKSVRPAHRMVAHTGFITTARRCVPKPRGQIQTSN